MTTEISLFRYHDLRERIAVWATDGGRHLRGDVEDLVIEDAEPLLAAGEQEVTRLAGLLQVAGSSSTAEDPSPSLCVALVGSAGVIVTTHRIIAMVTDGMGALGEVNHGELHTLVWPWDLVDTIGLSRTEKADRALGRTIDIFSGTTMTRLALNPAPVMEMNGQERAITDEDAFKLLVSTAATNRLAVSTESDADRVRAVLSGTVAYEKDEIVAHITADEPFPDGIPPHLRGRLARARPPRSHIAAAAALLLAD